MWSDKYNYYIMTAQNLNQAFLQKFTFPVQALLSPQRIDGFPIEQPHRQDSLNLKH
jgi:hypothetical protein